MTQIQAISSTFLSNSQLSQNLVSECSKLDSTSTFNLASTWIASFFSNASNEILIKRDFCKIILGDKIQSLFEILHHLYHASICKESLIGRVTQNPSIKLADTSLIKVLDGLEIKNKRNKNIDLQPEETSLKTHYLITATFRGDFEVLKLFKRAKADLDAQSKKPMVAYDGYTDIVKEKLKSIIYPSKKSNLNIFLRLDKGLTALMMAASCGYKAIAKELVEGNVNVNLQSGFGMTALMLAVYNAQTEIVKYLVEAGANLDLQDEDGLTALMYAALHGHTDIVKCLVEGGANLDLQNKDGRTALIRAADRGHTDIVKDLAEARANLDLQDEHGVTALIIAAYSGHTDTVRYLVEAGVNLDLQDEDGLTALILAAWCGHSDIVRCLVRGGANLDHQNEDRLTALILAAYSGHTNVVKYLVEGKANLDLKCKNANLDLKIEEGQPPLMDVPFFEELDRLKSPWRPQYKPALFCEIANTPLLAAVHYGHTDIVKYLVEAGADLNIQSSQKGETPLMRAAALGRTDIVKYLVEAGASLGIQSKKGETALTHAIYSARTKITRLLEKAMVAEKEEL